MSEIERKFPSLYNTKLPEDSLEVKTLAAIADAHAFEVWGSTVARGEPFPVFDSNDTAIAYVFPYAIGVSTFPAEIMPDPSQLDERERFGSIYVSTKPTLHPVLRVTHALHPLFLQGEQAETIGKLATANDACLTKIYWLGMHQEFFEVRSGEKRALMDVRNLKQVVPDSVLRPEPVVSEKSENNKYWKLAPTKSMPDEETLSYEKLKVELKKLTTAVLPASELGGEVLTPALKLVPLNDCVPVVNWTWWCVPTAFTMAVCYYDNYVKATGGILNYGRLVGYWFDHPKSGHNVPDFIDQLIDPATGTWRTGFNDFSDFIKKTYSYTFTTRAVSANAQNDWAWNDIKSEIDAGRPFVWGVPGHATCALGYRITTNGKFVVIHTTWGNSVTQQREEWPHTQGTGLTAINPGAGSIGQNLVIWQPDGGEKLPTNVATKLSWHIWGNQIKKAKILTSADGGKSWTTIAQAAPSAPGWNYYDWTPNTVTNRARVRIMGLDANGASVAGDGSQTNVQVLLGPRPVTLKTILVETKTDEKGFFSAPHGLERYTPDGYSIRAISVAVQHKNGNWHALEFSNNVDNRFWWNKDEVSGIIASPNFFVRPVRVVVFAEAVVG